MSYTFYGASLNGAVNKPEATSINISNNTSNTGVTNTAKTSFEGVIVSGADNKTNKDNTYEALLKETNDVKEQIMSSATDAKANLKALFNRLSGADAVAINEDGFNLNDMSQEEMVSIIDKIKIELATYCDDYNMPLNDISLDKLESVVGSKAGANAVASKMASFDIPLTQENVDNIADVLSKLDDIAQLSEDSKYLLLETNSDVTIENMTMVKYAVGSSNNTGKYEGKYGNKSGADCNNKDDVWRELIDQVKKIIEQAGLEVNEQNLENARGMFDREIPITKENLLKMNEINNINLDLEVVVDKVIEKMADGGKAEAANLTKDITSLVNEVAKALDILSRVADDETTKEAVFYALEKGEPTLNSIEEALDYINNRVDSQTSEQIVNKDNAYTESNADVNAAVNNSVKHLLEVQILLTAEAGSFLVNKGISINTVTVSTLHEHLLAFDKEVAMEKIAEQLAHDIDSEENMAAYNSSLELRRALYEINKSPLDFIGSLLSDSSSTTEYSIRAFMGASQNVRYQKAQGVYDKMNTQVRADYGDSLNKAVEASSESMLSDMNMENNESNREAVKILAANGIDVTPENVTLVKELNATLKSVIDNMTPQKALQLIRDNINPMDADIHDVNEYLKNMEITEDVNNIDKYSTFLYKLDRTEGISEKEREQYIGIFKMMNMFTKDAGRAIGSLLKADADITMANLASAYTSVRHSGNDYRIDDETDIKVVATTNYYMNIFEQTGYAITPNTLKEVQAERKINERSVEDFVDAAKRLYDAKAEAAYMDEYMKVVRAVSQADNYVLSELERADMRVTINSIEAMQMLVSGESYRNLFGTDSKKVDRFIEKLDDREALLEEYEALEEESNTQTKAVIDEKSDMTYDECRRINIGNQAMQMVNAMSKRNDYKVPFVTEDGVGMMNLTLISDTEENGRISVNYESSQWGSVSVEVKISGTKASITAVCQKNEQEYEKNINELASVLKSEFNLEECSVYCNEAKRVHRVTYNDAKNQVATNTLYKMSKTIVKTLTNLQ